MERVCTRLVRGVSSKKHPGASLERRALEYANINAIISTYDLKAILPPVTRIYASSRITSFTFPERDYSDITLHSPTRVINIKLNATADEEEERTATEMLRLRRRIAIHFTAQWNIPATEILKRLPNSAVAYSKLVIKNGDMIRSFFGGRGDADASTDARRDATFFEYELLVDRFAHRQRQAPSFKPRTYFGRLNRIVAINMVPLDEPNEPARTYILLDVDPCQTRRDEYGFYEYTAFKTSTIIDAFTARAVVGRILDDGKWVIVRRGGSEHAEYQGIDDDFEDAAP